MKNTKLREVHWNVCLSQLWNCYIIRKTTSWTKRIFGVKHTFSFTTVGFAFVNNKTVNTILAESKSNMIKWIKLKTVK